MLITNPSATTSLGWNRDVVVRSLLAELQLDLQVTSHRGHAIELAHQARETGLDIVLTLGGDGTVNEAINGLLTPSKLPCPVLGTIPGGLANVFPRSLGYSPDAMNAAGELLEAIAQQSIKTIPLGKMNGRWFAFNAGIGLDAAVVTAVEEVRRAGQKATPGRYVVESIKQIIESFSDRKPHLRVRAELTDGSTSEIERAFMLIVQNTTPWSFAGPIAVEMAAGASYERGGLDAVALTSLHPAMVAGFFAEGAARLPADRRAASTVLENCQRIAVEADEPLPAQVDGDAIGQVTRAEFEQVPAVLAVFAPIE